MRRLVAVLALAVVLRRRERPRGGRVHHARVERADVHRRGPPGSGRPGRPVPDQRRGSVGHPDPVRPEADQRGQRTARPRRRDGPVLVHRGRQRRRADRRVLLRELRLRQARAVGRPTCPSSSTAPTTTPRSRFTQGRLDAGESASLDQLAIRDPGGATYDQDDDHSFLSAGSFTDNPRVTAYIDGELVWGTEPEPLPEVESVEVQYANFDSDPLDNAIKPGLKIRNTGTVPIDLSRVTVRYWFTAEASKPFAGVLRLRGARVREGHHRLRKGQAGPSRERTPTSRSASAAARSRPGATADRYSFASMGPTSRPSTSETTTAAARTRPSPPR